MGYSRRYGVTANQQKGLDAAPTPITAANPAASVADVTALSEVTMTNVSTVDTAVAVLDGVGVKKIKEVTGLTAAPGDATHSATILLKTDGAGAHKVTIRGEDGGATNRDLIVDANVQASLLTFATGVVPPGYAVIGTGPGGGTRQIGSSGTLLATLLTTRVLGSVGCANMAIGMGDNFTAGAGHIDIGADVWNCIAGVPGAGTKEFQIGADRDASIVSAVAKINDATRGTEFVLAAALGSGEMLLSFADAVGGTAVAGVPTSMALAVVPGGAGTMDWDKNNLNESGAPASVKSASGRVVIGAAAAARIAASGIVFLGVLPFVASTTTSVLHVQVFSATGLVKACDDLFELGPSDVTVTGAAGAVPLIATDEVHWSVLGG